MGSPAIDFAALLAEAREEARARRRQQQQEQQQRQQQQRQQQQRQQQQRQQPQNEDRQRREEGQQLQLLHEQQAQHTECLGHGKTEGRQQASQQSRGRQNQEQRPQDGLGHQQQRQSMGEETRASQGDNTPVASHVVMRLRAVDVQNVYNELQQHSVGVGKPLLLVDLQKPSDFASRHIRQAISGHEVLVGGPLLQRLQQQPPQILLVYGSSHKEDQSFQQLMYQHSAAASACVNSSGTAAARSRVSADAAAAQLLQQLVEALQQSEQPTRQQRQERQQPGEQRQQQGEQQQGEQRQETSPCAASSSLPRPCEGAKGITVAWLRGGLAAFAAAFPFLCVSSTTEEEAGAALTAASSAAFMSYPLLVYRDVTPQQAPADAAIVAGSAASEMEAPTCTAADTAVSRSAAAVDLHSATLPPCRSPAGAAAKAGGHTVGDEAAVGSGAAAAARGSQEAVCGVHGLYVGTPLHATSKAVRRRLRIGLVIDLTCSGLPPRLSGSSCCGGRNNAFSSDSIASSRVGCSPCIRCSAGSSTSSSEEGKDEEAVQVLRPLVSPDTRAAVRNFLGYGMDGSDGSESAFPHWLEMMPQRQRELTAAAGRYLLPLAACVELLNHTFAAPARGKNRPQEPSAGFAGVRVKGDVESASECSSGAVGGNTCKSSGRSTTSETADSEVTCGSAGRQLRLQQQKEDDAVALVDSRAFGMSGDSSTNSSGRESVLIVHSGDSEAWSGSAAVAIVAGFLLAQQKRLQVVLPQQEVRTAMALLSASWRCAPPLEESHRQQLQRFCEEERKRISEQSFEGGDRKDAAEQRPASRCGMTERGLSSSLPSRASDASWATAGQRMTVERFQVAKTRSALGGRVEKEDKKEEDCSGRKTQDADDAYLAAAAALHTVNLCGLPADCVFILSGDKENGAARSPCGAADGREGEDPDRERKPEAKTDDEWPLHLLRHLGRIIRQVKLVVARVSASTEQDGDPDVCCTRKLIPETCRDGTNSSDLSADEGAVGQNFVAAVSRRSGGSDNNASNNAPSETAANDNYNGDNDARCHKEASAADTPASDGCVRSQEISEERLSGGCEQCEIGTVQLFVCLCSAEKLDLEGGAASTQEAVAQTESPCRLETGATAALTTKRVAGSHLCELSMVKQGRCADGSAAFRSTGDVGEPSPAMAECTNLCEAWELAANTVGCIVRTWSPGLGERSASRVCIALRALLELLAPGCRVTLWRALSTLDRSRNVLSRLTIAWGAFLLNICILWIRMASVIQVNVRVSEKEGAKSSRTGVSSSSPPGASHALLGETLLCTLLESILQLARRLLVSQQHSRGDDAALAPPEPRLPSRAQEEDLDRRFQITPSSAAYLSGVSAGFGALHARATGGEFPPRSAEGRETWLFGCPTLGLTMLLCALYGTFLRPQIAPKLHKKLVKAAGLLATVEVSRTGSVPVASTTSVSTEEDVSSASAASRAAKAEAAAAAAVSSVRRILKSEAVQSTLQLAEVWAAVRPENLQKLLQVALQGEGRTLQREDDSMHALGSTRLPTSLGMILRPLVYADEEYGGHTR